MRGSGRICYRVAVGILVLAFTACKCGEEKEKAKPAEPAGPEYQSTVSKLPGAQQADVAALIPQDAGLVMISDDLGRLLGWLEGRKWFQALKKTPFYDDLRFTGAWFRFSTLKHRLESVSAVRLGEARLEEMLKTPAGLALRPDGEGTEVLLVKQIDLRIQALDRLAEVFNQITPREGMLKSREVSGLNLRELAVDEQHRLYYLLFSNLLLISNSEKYLLQAADLARGESSGSIADDSEVAALLLDGRENFDLVACLDPDRLSAGKKEKGARLIESVERLLLKFKTGSPPRLEITGVLDKQRAGEELNAPFKAGNIVPLDSRMLLGLARVDLAAA